MTVATGQFAEARKANDAGAQDFGDHMILRPPETLRDMAYVATRRGDPAPQELLEQAERELNEIAVEFSDWMINETEKLADMRSRYRVYGATPETIRDLFQAAHTVRGDAGVFGYPLAGRVADSLAKLLDGCPREALPDALIHQHVDAIRAIVREDARGATNSSARALAHALIEAASKFIQPQPATNAAG